MMADWEIIQMDSWRSCFRFGRSTWRGYLRKYGGKI